MVLDLGPTTSIDIIPPPLVTAMKAPIGNLVTGPLGAPCGIKSLKGLSSQLNPQIKGTFVPPNPNPNPKLHCSHSICTLMAGVHGGSGGGDGVHDHQVVGEVSNVGHHLPKMNFPSFYGKNPKLWIRRYLDYFKMYPVLYQWWIKVATMHLWQVENFGYLGLQTMCFTILSSIH